MKPEKGKGGRPITGKETKKRYQVMLEPHTAERLRKAGGDNLSAGIGLAAERLSHHGHLSRLNARISTK